MAAVHVSPYAGSWYPGRSDDLDRLIAKLFEDSRRRTGPYLLPDPVAFVVPHAGLMYSGTVACAAYRYLCERRPERMVLLGFSHQGGPPGIGLPVDIEAVATPLGDIRLDRHTMADLARSSPFRWVPEQRVCDHSIEIQLPLLQFCAPGVLLTPLYVGPLSVEEREAAAEALACLAEPGTIFLASSDFTHYGRAFGFEPFPLDEQTPARLRALDLEAVKAASSLNAQVFLDQLAASGATVCGQAPIALLLRTLSLLDYDELFQEMLDYGTSADVAGDYQHCVSYATLGYFPATSFRIERADQASLLESAEATIRRLLESGRPEVLPPKAITPALTRPGGVFVSLHEEGHLRGCVGSCATRQSLAASVPAMTLAAALEDRRFEPMLHVSGKLHIEISLLTPMKRIPSSNSFRLGIHGVFLEAGVYRSILLPQVGDLRRWTKSEFLRALCCKVGAPPCTYTNPSARLAVFRAQVFGICKQFVLCKPATSE